MSNLETALGAGAVSWRYVSTGDNPADDITRRFHPVELNVNNRYSAGPEFFYKSAELTKEDKRERKRLRWVGVSRESEPVLGWKRYPFVAKLGRVLAYVMLFVNNTRVKKEVRQSGSLTAIELRAAQSHPVKKALVEFFGEEIRCLENGQEVHKRSRIKSLDPRMEGGFLVVGGRLQKTPSPPLHDTTPEDKRLTS